MLRTRAEQSLDAVGFLKVKLKGVIWVSVRYDLIVIGAGAAGLTAAFTALGFGKKVLLVEQAKPGGECTWSGCIPSKALINVAKDVHAARKITPSLQYDTSKAMAQVRRVIDAVYEEETPEVLIAAGAEYVAGAASFVDSKSITVNGQVYQGKKFIIATGSSPLIPPITGLDDVDYLTNESIFELAHLPDSMIVLGGGAIGVELAQAMNRLGVQVDLVEMMPDIMFREEAEFAQTLRENIATEGVRFHVDTKALKVQETPNGVQVLLESKGIQSTLQGEALLLALGRKPNRASLGLENIGVACNNGITVNSKLQTSVSNIYACGDVAGPYQFSHMANYQAKLATMNAILPFSRKASYENAAWTTFTEPEFAHAGLTEAQARVQYGNKVRVYDYSFSKLDRAKTKAGDSGQIKLITDTKSRVLGAHILGERAGELICQVQTMKHFKIPFGKLQAVIHPYPTYADGLRQLAQQVYIDSIFKHPLVVFFQRIKARFSGKAE